MEKDENKNLECPKFLTYKNGKLDNIIKAMKRL